MVDATPPVGGSKVDARFAMTPKVIARAQSIKEKTLVPPTPVTDDAAEGDDERHGCDGLRTTSSMAACKMRSISAGMASAGCPASRQGEWPRRQSTQCMGWSISSE